MKSLERQQKTVYCRRTDNAMTNRKSTNGQTKHFTENARSTPHAHCKSRKDKESTTRVSENYIGTCIGMA